MVNKIDLELVRYQYTLEVYGLFQKRVCKPSNVKVLNSSISSCVSEDIGLATGICLICTCCVAHSVSSRCVSYEMYKYSGAAVDIDCGVSTRPRKAKVECGKSLNANRTHLPSPSLQLRSCRACWNRLPISEVQLDPLVLNSTIDCDNGHSHHCKESTTIPFARCFRKTFQ